MCVYVLLGFVQVFYLLYDMMYKQTMCSNVTPQATLAPRTYAPSLPLARLSLVFVLRANV